MVMSPKTKSKAPRRSRREKSRDDEGRFRPGFSGNPKGRPRKVIELPKHLAEEIAYALAEKVAVTGADGTVTRISAYQDIVRQLVHSITAAKPKELLAILREMEALGVFAWMRQNAEPPPEIKVSKEDLALLAMAKAKVAEEARLRCEASTSVQRKQTPPGPSAAPASPHDSGVKPRQPAKRPPRKAVKRQPPGGKRAK